MYAAPEAAAVSAVSGSRTSDRSGCSFTSSYAPLSRCGRIRGPCKEGVAVGAPGLLEERVGGADGRRGAEAEERVGSALRCHPKAALPLLLLLLLLQQKLLRLALLLLDGCLVQPHHPGFLLFLLLRHLIVRLPLCGAAFSCPGLRAPGFSMTAATAAAAATFAAAGAAATAAAGRLEATLSFGAAMAAVLGSGGDRIRLLCPLPESLPPLLLPGVGLAAARNPPPASPPAPAVAEGGVGGRRLAPADPGFRLAEEGTLEGTTKDGVEAEAGVRLLIGRLEGARATWAPPAAAASPPPCLGAGEGVVRSTRDTDGGGGKVAEEEAAGGAMLEAVCGCCRLVLRRLPGATVGGTNAGVSCGCRCTEGG